MPAKRNPRATKSARRARRADTIHVYWSGNPLLWVAETPETSETVETVVDVEVMKVTVPTILEEFTTPPGFWDRITICYAKLLGRLF
jgi:hypothetical protein